MSFRIRNDILTPLSFDVSDNSFIIADIPVAPNSFEIPNGNILVYENGFLGL